MLVAGGVLVALVAVAYAVLPNPAEAPSESDAATTSTTNGANSGGKPASGGNSGGTQTQPQKVRLLMPNGGETWQRGQQYQVKWTIAIDSRDVQVIIFPSTSVITNPFAVSPARIVGQEMFNSNVFPTKSAEGSYTYKVPQNLTPGTYQVLIWAGDKCSTNQIKTGCAYDLSDRLFTVR